MIAPAHRFGSIVVIGGLVGSAVFVLLWPWTTLTAECVEGVSCPTVYRNLLGMEWVERDQPLPIVAAIIAFVTVVVVGVVLSKRRGGFGGKGG